MLPLPPQVFLNFRSTGGKEVIEVHNNMNTSIEHSSEASVATADKLDSKPSDHGHDGVVNHMKGGEMGPFLSQHKEYGIEKVNDFGKEKEP